MRQVIGGVVRGLCALVVGVCGASAGPLTPPPGPVASTGKTLVEVEPRIAINATNTPGDADSVFRITGPGSYYLTGTVTAVSGKTTIEIASSNVTIDLMGYALKGSAAALAGIRASVVASNITVRNGVVTSFPESGVELFFPSRVTGCVVEDIQAVNNGGLGISAGENAVVRGCVANGNTGIGIAAGNGSSILGCVSAGNGGQGFFAGDGSTFADCSAFDNVRDGFASGGATLSNCTARNNDGDGFDMASSTMIACTAGANGGSGFFIFESSVQGCFANFNGSHGVAAASNCLIVGNSCNNNGSAIADGAGIFTTGNDNRIEGNNCADNDRGVRVSSTGSVIFGNSCSGNAINYDIAASNRYGPIVNITATGTAAVTGSAAPSTLTTTDPWANFAY